MDITECWVSSFNKESNDIGFSNIWSNLFLDCQYNVCFKFLLRKWVFSGLFLAFSLVYDISVKGVL